MANNSDTKKPSREDMKNLIDNTDMVTGLFGVFDDNVVIISKKPKHECREGGGLEKLFNESFQSPKMVEAKVPMAFMVRLMMASRA